MNDYPRLNKKLSKMIILIMVLAFVSGCKPGYSQINKYISSTQDIQNNNAPLTAIPTQSQTSNDYQFNDDDFYLRRYITGLDIVMPDLTFTDATKITAEDLFVFFRYIVDYERLFQYQDWFNKNENRYHIPVSVIEPTLKKYLNIGPINVNTLEGYDIEKNEMVTLCFAGFGGDRFPKIYKKEYLGNDTVRLTVVFYDNTYTQVNRTKIYSIQIDPADDTRYKYLSIVQSPIPPDA